MRINIRLLNIQKGDCAFQESIIDLCRTVKGDSLEKIPLS